MRDIKTFLKQLSHHPGVYQMLDEKGTVLYVGKAKNLKKRIASYFTVQKKDLKTESLVKHIKDIDCTITHSEKEAILLECNLIKKYKPRYNILLRDDKSYPYILITQQHPYPRIDIFRGQRKKNILYFGPYPNALAVRETISLLQKMFKIRTCRDHYFAARTRPCLLYEIERCTGPCVKLISHEDYAKNVQLAILFLQGKNDQVIELLQQRMEVSSKELNYELAVFYRDQINRLRQIQDKQYIYVNQGNVDAIGLVVQAGMSCIQLLSIRHGQVQGSRSYFPLVPSHSTSTEIMTSFIKQHYLADSSHIESIPKLIVIEHPIAEYKLLETVLMEQAQHKVEINCPSRGEKKKWLDMAIFGAKQALATHLFYKSNVQKRLLALQQVLHLSSSLRRIECFDVSHSAGESTVASCVVFDESGPVKSAYRRFNITNITPGDDVAAMHQVLLRRFKRLQNENAVLPDVVLIDGGLTQRHAAKKALLELGIHTVEVVGVAKGPERKPGFETLHLEQGRHLHLPADSLALHVIQQIRDEAHRFAIVGHRHKRDKARRQSSLEFISGVGPKRRRDLLRYFGGIQGVAHASLEELMKVSGINRALAERIFAALHDATL